MVEKALDIRTRMMQGSRPPGAESLSEEVARLRSFIEVVRRLEDFYKRFPRFPKKLFSR